MWFFDASNSQFFGFCAVMQALCQSRRRFHLVLVSMSVLTLFPVGDNFNQITRPTHHTEFALNELSCRSVVVWWRWTCSSKKNTQILCSSRRQNIVSWSPIILMKMSLHLPKNACVWCLTYIVRFKLALRWVLSPNDCHLVNAKLHLLWGYCCQHVLNINTNVGSCPLKNPCRFEYLVPTELQFSHIYMVTLVQLILNREFTVSITIRPCTTTQVNDCIMSCELS